MSPLRPLAALVLLCAATGLVAPLSAAPKPGYTVVLDVSVNEKGVATDAKIEKTEDQSGDHILEQIAMEKVHVQNFEVRMKDGKAMPYKARVPFVFPIEGDEGPEANLAPRPRLTGSAQAQPVYPPEYAAKGEPGSAILEITVGDDGQVKYATVLRATEQVFADSAVAAVKQWHFAAAEKDGRPVSSRWRLAIVFQTEESEPIWEWRIPPRPSLGTYYVMHMMKRPVSPATPAPGLPAAPPPANPPAPGK
ncbi:MAG TPA: energy transducer TonB [Candidatus Didemnitutus sp.]|jgi:TonB family protein